MINAPRDPAALDCLRALGEPQIAHGRWWTLHRLASGHSTLIFDYCTTDHCPPIKQSWARQNWGDAALMLFADGTHTDVSISPTLTQDSQAITNAAMAVLSQRCRFSVQHLLTGSAEQKKRAFECRLHHYTSGLAFAKSQYASYPWFINRRQSRGLCQGSECLSAPLEDFYLLNKLAKVGDVVPLRTQRSGSLIDNLIGFRLAPIQRCTRLSAICKNEWPTFYAPQLSNSGASPQRIESNHVA